MKEELKDLVRSFIWVAALCFCGVVMLSVGKQTVPVSPTRQLQTGISVGAGLYAEPDAALQAQAVVVCAGTGGMTACISANNAIATDANRRALVFMNDVFKNYSGANQSLQANGLWFKTAP